MLAHAAKRARTEGQEEIMEKEEGRTMTLAKPLSKAGAVGPALCEQAMGEGHDRACAAGGDEARGRAGFPEEDDDDWFPMVEPASGPMPRMWASPTVTLDSGRHMSQPEPTLHGQSSSTATATAAATTTTTATTATTALTTTATTSTSAVSAAAAAASSSSMTVGLDPKARCSRLHVLELVDAGDLTNTGLRRITERFPNLTQLRIVKASRITSYGIKHLACLPLLRSLHLTDCKKVGAIELPSCVHVQR